MPRPTLTGLTVTESRGVRAVVQATGGAPLVRVDEAVVQAGQAAPSLTSRLWSEVATVAAGSVVQTAPRQTRDRTWLRASGRNASGARMGLYSTPVAVQVPPVPRLEAVELLVDDGGAVVRWTPEGPVDVVRVRSGVHTDGEDAELGTAELRPPDDGLFSLLDRPAIGERVTVELEPVDAGELYMLDGAVVTDQAGGELTGEDERTGPARTLTELRPLDLGTVEAPRHWLFTEGGVPVRDGDFALVTASGLAPEDDWLMLSDGRPARLITLDIVRSTS